MAKYTLYGKQASRTSRVTWMFRELGVDFTHVEDHAPLGLNPNDSVPTLKVEEAGKPPFVMYESFAINQFLAKTAGGGWLGPRSVEEDAQISQWPVPGLVSPTLFRPPKDTQSVTLLVHRCCRPRPSPWRPSHEGRRNV